MTAETATAKFTLVGHGPLSQSHQHDEPKAHSKEGHDDYDARTWRSKLNLSRDGSRIIIPSHGFRQALTAAAKYSGLKVPNARGATFTKKFESSVWVPYEILTNRGPNDPQVTQLKISANADGVRGSGKRVPRRFPMINDWTADVTLLIADPVITEQILRDTLHIAGNFIGLGRFRPERGGDNGRFGIENFSFVYGEALLAAE